ncbi:MAG: hypothetical protein K9G57_01060 [Ignavibacteriales bacterium]|nr:hypothetical protein [Ignavibacteriales bacterium]
MKKSMVYFILYVVLIVELLIVITERDELEEKEHEIRDKMIVQLAQNYKQPVFLQIPQSESTYNIGSKEPHKIIMTPVGLSSSEEADFVEYFIDIAPSSRNRPAGWPQGGISLSSGTNDFKIQKGQGNAIFLGQFKSGGDYSFVAYCQVDRQLPTYLTTELLHMLKEEIGEQQKAVSEKEKFLVSVKVGGGVQTMQSEISF